MGTNYLGIAELTQKVLDFRDARDWKQYHNPKDLSLALVIEVGELLELFRFKSDAEITTLLSDSSRRKELEGELADIFYFLLLLAYECDMDLGTALISKLKILDERYPVELAKGRNVKYTEL